MKVTFYGGIAAAAIAAERAKAFEVSELAQLSSEHLSTQESEQLA